MPVTRAAERQGGMYLCFLGFCLVVSLSTTLSLYVGKWGGSAVPHIGWLTSAVRVAALLAIALLSGRIGALSSHRAPLRLATVAATVGSALVVTATFLGFSGAPVIALYVCGLILNALGYALLNMYWIELYARMDLMHVIAYYSLVHLLSAGISLALTVIPSQAAVSACVVVLPVASSLLYTASLRCSATVPFMQGEQPSSGWSVPWRPIVLLGTFMFANSFVRHFLNNDLRGAVLVGVMLAAAFALALFTWRRERLDLRTLYSTSLPLIVAASLCVLVGLPGFGTMGGVLSNAAYTLFSIYATVLLCNVSFRYGVGPLWLFGFAYASTNLGSLATNVLVMQVDFLTVDQTSLTLAMGAVIMVFICLYMAFGTSGESASAWGLTRESAGQTDDEPPLESLEHRCARLARRAGLTRREEEVVTLLAQDASYAEVEERLSIANSTLKTHVRHIYAKLGVSDKRGLMELVASEDA